MSSSVSKGISHRIFNIIIIEVKRDGGINDNYPVDGAHLISVCIKLLVIKSLVKHSWLASIPHALDCWLSTSEFSDTFNNFFSPIVHDSSFKDAPEKKN